jgi:hypothetical protein
LKKYSSTVATIFTGLASAAFLGHKLTNNFLLGISVVFISMHQVNVPFLLISLSHTLFLFCISHTVICPQFFSPMAKVKDDKPTELVELEDSQNHR